MYTQQQAEQAYKQDPTFRTLVDHMVAAIRQNQYTPADLRAAAHLASIIYAQIYPAPYVWRPGESEG